MQFIKQCEDKIKQCNDKMETIVDKFKKLEEKKSRDNRDAAAQVIENRVTVLEQEQSVRLTEVYTHKIHNKRR